MRQEHLTFFVRQTPSTGTWASRSCGMDFKILRGLLPRWWDTGFFINLIPTSLVAQTEKRLSTMRETSVRSLSREDLLEKEMTIHSSTIAWKILWTEEPGRLQSMGLQRVRHDWATSPSLSLPLNWASPWWFRWWRICFHAGNLGSISESRRSAGEGNHYPLQYSCLENEHEQMSLAGCSPCGLKELDKTERLTFNTLNTLTHTHNLF